MIHNHLYYGVVYFCFYSLSRLLPTCIWHSTQTNASELNPLPRWLSRCTSMSATASLIPLYTFAVCHKCEPNSSHCSRGKTTLPYSREKTNVKILVARAAEVSQENRCRPQPKQNATNSCAGQTQIPIKCHHLFPMKSQSWMHFPELPQSWSQKRIPKMHVQPQG